MAYTTIDDPAQFFNTVLYTGDGNNGRTVTGVGFQPDFVWLKSRSEAEHHTLNDSVRGANNQIYSHLAYSNATDTDRLQSFDSDGFTLGTDVIVNKNTETFVSWNWKAANSSGSANSNGTINSTVSVNTTAGFSICSWTHDGGNSTIGHGLGAIPQVVITKERNNSGSWNSYFSAVGNAHRMVLQGTNAKISSSIWNSTTPTSTVFSMNDSITSTMIAYCFCEKKGYSKFGSYTGNGNANGTFVNTGFRPAWLMIKRFDDTSDWSIYDIKREAANPQYEFDLQIEANDNAAEGSDGQFGIYSNGFKFRSNDSFTNASDGEYLFMAFAESPFVNSNGIPTNAR